MMMKMLKFRVLLLLLLLMMMIINTNGSTFALTPTLKPLTITTTTTAQSTSGMLLSSVTLGLLSDKFGRLCCIRTGFVISILATIGAILSHNYFLLNICFVLMSYAQVGVANAICTLGEFTLLRSTSWNRHPLAAF